MDTGVDTHGYVGYAHTMSNYNDADNTIYGGYGEFDPFGTLDWTDEDWAEYDAQVEAEIEAWEDAHWEDWDNAFASDEGTPPF